MYSSKQITDTLWKKNIHCILCAFISHTRRPIWILRKELSHFYLLKIAHLLVTQHTFIWLGSINLFLIIRRFAAVKIHFSAITAPPPLCKWCITACQGKALCGARRPPNTLLWRSRSASGRPHSENCAIHTENHIFVYIHTEGILNVCYCCGWQLCTNVYLGHIL